jgi:outer membrane protein
MKKVVYGLAAFIIYGTSIGAIAAPTPPPATASNVAPTKVGVLDMHELMERSTQIAQIRDKLQREFKPKQDKLIAAQNVLKNDSDRLRRDNAIMSNSDRKQLEQKIINEQQELQRLQANFQQELMSAQNKELKNFLDSIRGVVEKIAAQEGLSVVITRDTVVYVKPDFDITNKVIQQLPHK